MNYNALRVIDNRDKSKKSKNTSNKKPSRSKAKDTSKPKNTNPQNWQNRVIRNNFNDLATTNTNFTQKEDKPKHKTKYAWLFEPEKGLRWDFDPVMIRMESEENPWVQMMNQSISKEVAQTSWQVVKNDSTPETQKRLNNNPFEREVKKAEEDNITDEITELLYNPAPHQNWHDLITMGETDLLQVGSATLVKDFPESAYDNNELVNQDAKPLNIRISDPVTWTKSYRGKTGVLDGYYQYDTKARGSSSSRTHTDPIFFKPEEVIWDDLNPRSNRRYGLPPTLLVKSFIQLINLAIEQEKQYFSRGSIPSGMIVLEDWDIQEMQDWKEEIMQNVKGKPHKILTVPTGEGDVRFEPFSFNFKELQFLEREQWYAKVIASCYQVPVSVVGLKPEKVNYNTFQGERQNYESNTLGSYLQKWERLLNHQLIHPHFGTDYHFEFIPGLSEESRSKISTRVVQEYSTGIINQNEAREQLGYDELEDGDEFREPEPEEGNPMADLLQQSRQQSKGEPLRETDNWWEFNYQPSDIKEIKEKISSDVRDLWQEILDNEQIDDLIQRFATEEKSLTGISSIFNKILGSSKMIDVVMQTTLETTNSKAMEVLEEASSETELEVEEDPIKARLEERDMGFVNEYAQRMESEIRDIVSEGWTEGKSVHDIKENLRDKADEFTDYQAERIARDQLQRATGEARNEFAQQHSDKFVEVWNTAEDHRVREAHKKMNGKWKHPQEKFKVDYDGKYVLEEFPGDSKEGIMCRCDTLLKPKDEVKDKDHKGVTK